MKLMLKWLSELCGTRMRRVVVIGGLLAMLDRHMERNSDLLTVINTRLGLVKDISALKLPIVMMSSVLEKDHVSDYGFERTMSRYPWLQYPGAQQDIDILRSVLKEQHVEIPH